MLNDPNTDHSAPLHPHPLSNDLTDESLPPRSRREEEIDAEGVGAAPRHVGKVVGGVIAFLVAMALIGTAVMLGQRWELILLGAGIFVLYLVFIGAPILLAAGTKAAQDEAVREEKAHSAPASTSSEAGGPSSAEARQAAAARAAAEARGAEHAGEPMTSAARSRSSRRAAPPWE